MTTVEILKKTPFIRELNDKQLEQLAALGGSEVFEAGEYLVRQGRLSEKIYVIEEGLVGIYLELGPMTRRQVQSASNFEVVGWSAMLPPYRARSTAIAMERTRVLTFNGKELVNLCLTDPKIGCIVHRGLASLIATRLHNAYTQLMGVAHQD